MDKIRIGVSGVRRGTFVAHVCRCLEGANVTAVYDPVPETAQAVAATIDGCRAFVEGQWQVFLESGIEAVVVSPPVPFHVAQSVDCLERGLHVLSEVPAVASIAEARALLRAVEHSKASYMLAENCNYLDEIELLRRMVADGLLGDTYHAEGGYLHDCKFLWKNADGSLTWRGKGLYGVYCTHTLGPLLSVLKDRIAQVSCLAQSGKMFDPDSPVICNYNLLMRTAAGKSVVVRVDAMSPRPYACDYRVQGTRGVYEFTFGQDTEPRVSLTGDHKWHGGGEFRAKYLSDRLAVPEEARKAGHGSMEYWMMKDWLEALRRGGPMPIDVHAALDMTLPGIVAAESARNHGQVLPVPDSRQWSQDPVPASPEK